MNSVAIAICRSLRKTPLLLLFFLPAGLSAQLGVQLQYRLPLSLAESSMLSDPLIQSGWSAGVVYSLRRSGIRIEWVPGLHYMQTTAQSTASVDYTGSGVQATVDFRAYPLDMYGDCKCPTFSRKGQVIKKGFFVEGGAGGYYLSQKTGDGSQGGGNFLARIGAGLDIGLSRRLTITPGVRIQYENSLHAWGGSGTEKQSRPLWVYPYLQIMTYFDY
ncbi:MAG: acyloxyacyl hydrolase [Saprospiraceae bacterium]|nr:acyloxyacyl hydrolase [Saprospiraceae bacterium]